jgi:hypothetical protein
MSFISIPEGKWMDISNKQQLLYKLIVRKMNSFNFKKAGILTLILIVISVASWEFYLRNKGYFISYDDGESLWSHNCGEVDQPSDQATVFIGSSRIKYDLDIPTWEKIAGENAVQLAMEGNSPRPVLTDLANNPNFKGKLIIDVTEGLFFSSSPGYNNQAGKNIEYSQKITPAEKASLKIDHLLESQLVFLDKNFFSFNALLKKLPVHDRPGIYGGPDFPWEFDRNTFKRQSYMSSSFVADTVLQNKVRNIWFACIRASGEPPASGTKLDSILLSVKTDCDKIKARGGQIIFVRTPSSGPFVAGEKKAFPREVYWDKLLTVTNCPGIHFEDYPAIAHFQCPEFSHLKPADAVVFTWNFINIIQEKGWFFPHKQSL